MQLTALKTVHWKLKFIRPSDRDDSREVLCFTAVLFQPPHVQPSKPAKAYQRLDPKLKLFNPLRHFAHPDPNFYNYKWR